MTERLNLAQFRALIEPLVATNLATLELRDLETLRLVIDGLWTDIDDEYMRRDDLGELVLNDEEKKAFL
jgi:hypothetical protein